ncbi:hypothetical protein GCM10010399_86620 [Dactylosporangium fulvum]|uniref:ABC transporter substrate-binding protein n=1 Tax=Dactylosporangium fulvum TaxID=53359 RepID=A0ABY5W6P2_9ACTN|nr:ABC transporter substrate-binding protein [Dactylosporangium fulvum]UWP85050.1 ABC transporter substrate-binding protein [Dactylosporangium fulvum]
MGNSATQASRARWITAALTATAVTLAGCGTRKTESGQEPETPVVVRLYGADANMTNALRDKLKDNPSLLSGMTGTAPLLKLPEAFKNRLRTVDGALADFGYAAEAYDAVIITALAAEAARTTEATVFAKHVVGVTTSGTTCDSAATCLPLAKSGKDFAYRGVSMSQGGMTDQGEPSTASYGTLHFGRDNTINDNLTEYVGAGDSKTASTAAPPPPASDKNKRPAPLKVGALMPHTGRLAYRSAPRFAGAKLAIADLNAAGGVLGVPVEYVDGDDGTDAKVAAATVDRFISQGVQVMVGASSSSVTKAVIPKVVEAGRILISPSSTSDELSNVADNGLFFRTAPPDALQARALSDVIMRDGPHRVVIVAREDAYGMGLQGNVKANLVASGMTEDSIDLMSYPATAEDFSGLATRVRELKPDGVLIVGYEETALIVRALATKKVGTEGGLAGA